MSQQEAAYFVPTDNRGLRACLLCGIVHQGKYFKKFGCPNCEELLHLSESSDDVLTDCTSTMFEGTIAMMKPRRSWVAKWQRNDGFVSGLYAVRVQGTLPEDIIDDLSRMGVQYRPRDGQVID
ncbi:transcriptional elongation protein Spt4 [Saitoella complicata NRRL Y-17804]|uniref:transcriptional elongation protein Spt4 n=1 Tax=Saitoella complicata (strain BCRC 22490 / CBS 7301 / JCM 7358 / NBRC 10748 / NRRL Y-17804) TaxID=698492 RepID=UPI00086750C6|nr:transcriptional elongation protein Spt4 [Saitoella complicata NRRL Y-17804]ODQ55430.1 transcriptional elongation protein Spt4 [Saitoella complicata NRRL Y-17804]